MCKTVTGRMMLHDLLISGAFALIVVTGILLVAAWLENRARIRHVEALFDSFEQDRYWRDHRPE